MKTLPLREPLEMLSAKDGAVVSRIAELRLRPPRLGDLVAAMDEAGQSPGTMVLHIAARCTGVAARDLANLGLEDGADLLAAVQDFMPAGLLTGKGGSAPLPPNSASPPTGDAGGQPTSPSGLHVRLNDAE